MHPSLAASSGENNALGLLFGFGACSRAPPRFFISRLPACLCFPIVVCFRCSSFFSKQQADFQLITKPTLCLLTYRLCPAKIQLKMERDAAFSNRANPLIDELIVAVQKQQREQGKSFVSRTRFEVSQYKNQAITVFRVVLSNPLTTEGDLEKILQEQKKIAAALPLWKEIINLI